MRRAIPQDRKRSRRHVAYLSERALRALGFPVLIVVRSDLAKNAVLNDLPIARIAAYE
jgi:hypothetical protein